RVKQDQVGVGSADVNAQPVAPPAHALTHPCGDPSRFRTWSKAGTDRSRDDTRADIMSARRETPARRGGKRKMGTFKEAIGASILALSALDSSTAGAQSVADFYRGKTISMVIATAP